MSDTFHIYNQPVAKVPNPVHHKYKTTTTDIRVHLSDVQSNNYIQLLQEDQSDDLEERTHLDLSEGVKL